MKNKIISLIIGIAIGGLIVYGYSMFFGVKQMRPNGPMGTMGQNSGTGNIISTGAITSTGIQDIENNKQNGN